MEVSTYLPLFPGFYGTIFEVDDEEIYDCLASIVTAAGIEITCDGAEVLLNSSVVEFNYSGYNNDYLARLVEEVSSQLSRRLPISLEFEHIESPREYNFTNDVGAVKATIRFEEFKQQLVELTRDNKVYFDAFIRRRFTSGPGFISFHSNAGDEWLQELRNWKKGSDYDSTRFGTFLDFVLIHVINYGYESLYHCTQAPELGEYLSGKLLDTLWGGEIPKLWLDLCKKAEEYGELMRAAGNTVSSNLQLDAHYCNLAEVIIADLGETHAG